MYPALAGSYFTTESLGKPNDISFLWFKIQKGQKGTQENLAPCTAGQPPNPAHFLPTPLECLYAETMYYFIFCLAVQTFVLLFFLY